MTDAPKLKPCPFCGETPTEIWQCGERYFPNPAPIFVVRHSCTPGHGDSEELAAAKWNTRADLIDMDVLRRVEAALEARCETYLAAGGFPLDDDVIHQLEADALADLRAMMERLK